MRWMQCNKTNMSWSDRLFLLMNSSLEDSYYELTGSVIGEKTINNYLIGDTIHI